MIEKNEKKQNLKHKKKKGVRSLMIELEPESVKMLIKLNTSDTTTPHPHTN